MWIIYKYPIALAERFSVPMPLHSKILSVQYQRETLCMWAQINQEETEIEEREFAVLGTGISFSPLGTYITTVLSPDRHSLYVWHIYEVTD